MRCGSTENDGGGGDEAEGDDRDEVGSSDGGKCTITLEVARAGGGTASADSVSEQLARDDGSLVVVGSGDHLLGGETEVSDRGSNFELNGAGIRRTGPSGIEKDGNFHRRRPVWMLTDYVRALKRAGALRPQRQAVPAVGEQVMEAVRKEVDRDTQLAIVLCWAGAARVSDVIRLKVGDITLEREYVAVNWSETKSDPFRLGRTTGLYLADKWRNALQTAMTGLSPGDLLLDTSYRKVVAALRREGKDLSGHSLRRGALHTLLLEGVGLESIRQLSRHSSLDALARYLPAGKTHVARQSAETSWKLGTEL